MKKLILILGLATATTLGNAGQLYQCTDVNGRKVFSQMPCAPEAEAVDLHYQEVDEADVAEAEAIHRQREKMLEEAAAEDARRELESEIAATKRRINRLVAERDARIAANRRKAEYANNNLAGATWEGALAAENRAIAEQFNPDIAAARERLKDLRAQR